MSSATSDSAPPMIPAMPCGRRSASQIRRSSAVKVRVMINGLFLSHCWRIFLRRRGWIDRNGAAPVPHIVLGVVVLSVLQVVFLVCADVLIRDGILIGACAHNSTS